MELSRFFRGEDSSTFTFKSEESVLPSVTLQDVLEMVRCEEARLRSQSNIAVNIDVVRRNQFMAGVFSEFVNGVEEEVSLGLLELGGSVLQDGLRSRRFYLEEQLLSHPVDGEEWEMDLYDGRALLVHKLDVICGVK